MRFKNPFSQSGIRVADFVLPLDGSPTHFYSVAGGRPTVMVVGGCHVELPEGLDCYRADIGAGLERARSFDDSAGVVAQALAGDPAWQGVVVLDADNRILWGRDGSEVLGTDVARLLGELASADSERQAPILLVPRVLESRICAALARMVDKRGVDTGVERTSAAGRVDEVDAALKRRRDHVVSDPDLISLLTSTLGQRLLPEVQRAFAYKADRFEGFKLARYTSADQGHFEAHRDNLSPATAHRRFAVSLCLTDDYEGGELVFPEYGLAGYRPRLGEAIVFSCALLHRVMPVLKGDRYVVLSFLYSGTEGRAGFS